MVEGHVLAKRYLCFKDPEYYNGLSPSSKATLVFQGKRAACRCAANERRRGDDGGGGGSVCGRPAGRHVRAHARDRRGRQGLRCIAHHHTITCTCNQEVGKTVPGFDAYQAMVEAAIAHPPRLAEACKGSFVRDGNTLLRINEQLLA